MAVRKTTSCRQARNRLVWIWLPLLVAGFAGSRFAVSAETQPAVREKLIMGWLESVFLRPQQLRVTAKLDTGAKTSSVNAGQIEHFNRNGAPWVRFIFKPGQDQRSVVVERPLVRTAVIKERLSRSSKRDVVTLTVCKNGRDYETEFTLNDRSNFNYPILLGRSFLADVALVDSAATFLHKADNDACTGSNRSPAADR
mgnify:CR=1 FL=1